MNVTVQYAGSRRGVPHARTLSQWASEAFQTRAPKQTRGSRRSADVTIRVIGAAESRKLNATWRGKDKPTNVLSFPSDPLWPAASGPQPIDSAVHLGDLAICAPVVAREAREQDKFLKAHWAHMVVHGVLHLLGDDHENDRDAQQMEARERAILARFGFPDPYRH